MMDQPKLRTALNRVYHRDLNRLLGASSGPFTVITTSHSPPAAEPDSEPNLNLSGADDAFAHKFVTLPKSLKLDPLRARGKSVWDLRCRHLRRLNDLAAASSRFRPRFREVCAEAISLRCAGRCIRSHVTGRVPAEGEKHLSNFIAV